MPTYEYACPNCGHQFEAFQSMKDAPLKECPACKQPVLKRLLGTGAGLIFKGSGFYITDYKNKGGGGGGSTSSGSSSSSSSDTKSSSPKSSESKSTGGGGDSKSSGAASKTP